MRCRSSSMALAAVTVAALAGLVGALVPPATGARAPTLDPVQFEAAFQGQCGEGSPCEQLCLELHDGTFECGCGPGYVLHVDGYECLELNATRPSDSTTDTDEDVLYQKVVSFSAALDITPSSKFTRRLSAPAHDRTKHTDLRPEKNSTKSEQGHAAKENYTITGERSKEEDGLASLLEEGISKSDINMISDKRDNELAREEIPYYRVTTQGPDLAQKVPAAATLAPPWTAAVENCNCGGCEGNRCSCPGKCKSGPSIATPRFSGASWLALRALRGAYKRVRVRIRVRPERTRGVLLLTGEHDDLSGDYLALILRQGRVELRFDCGSGAGVLRSPEPVRLGRWNTISIYRHRWDAWLRLNNGKRVRGRSKGLFSRMTFREPVWVGGAGNTTGLENKLGLSEGLLGCVDFLRINGDTYRLVEDAMATSEIAECAPTLAAFKPSEATTNEAVPHSHSAGDHHAIYDINDILHFEDNDIVMRDSAHKVLDQNDLDNSIEHIKHDFRINGYVSKIDDVQKILSDLKKKTVPVFNEVDNELKSDEGKAMKVDNNDDNCACQHGGACIAGICLCPLGYAGVRCEITLDLKVPRFNGSSYLRLPGLGNSAQAWLDIQITLKPTSGDGLVLYDAASSADDGDFFSLHLRDYFVEFAFDLGSGIALVRSANPLEANRWHRVTVNRSGRHATLSVGADETGRGGETRSVKSRGAARRLTLNQPMFLGGAPYPLPQRLALQSTFSGCVSQLIINDEALSVVSSALGGVNVANCEEPHNDSCADKSGCLETLNSMPMYPQNLTETDQHAVVAKKGFKSKLHKAKFKKHNHTEKSKKKKYIPSKKNALYQMSIETSNDILADGPVYDGQTYMQVNYMDPNDINWGDTNTYPSFMGTDSFIHIDDEETMKRLVSYSLDINVRFRARNSHGLLVWTGGARGGGGGGGRDVTLRGERPGEDFLSLGIEGSVLVFRYNLGSGEVVITANHTKVDDGLWHRARATRNRQAGVLEVDGLGSVGKISPGKLKQLNTENGLFIGGLPSIEFNTMGKYKSGLIGCVSQISLSGDFDIPLSLSKLPHTITSNVGRCAP